MTRNCIRAVFFFFIIFISIGALLTGCSKEPAKRFNANELQKFPASESRGASSPSPKIAQSPESFVLDPNRLQPGQFWEVLVNNFIVIMDASGSKYLPYSGKVKLRVAKDVVRRLNQKTPERPLVGGLRRYGYEAGAWSVRTALLYGMEPYSRPDYGSSIDIVRWAGGKSPLELAIDKASDDFQSCDGYLALVVVSDGKVYDSDPIEAAKRIKRRNLYLHLSGRQSALRQRTDGKGCQSRRMRIRYHRGSVGAGKCDGRLGLRYFSPHHPRQTGTRTGSPPESAERSQSLRASQRSPAYEGSV